MIFSRRDFLKAPTAALLLSSALRPVFANESAGEQKIKVAQVNFVPENDGGWSITHKLGLEAVKQLLGDRMEFSVYHAVNTIEDATRLFRELGNSGFKLVFVTSYALQEATLEVAPEFPEVLWEQCAGTQVLSNLGTFDAKYYEGTYVAGIAAAHVSQSAKIGFVGGGLSSAVVCAGNAFLLGAQSVNPEVNCHAFFLDSWFSPESEREAGIALLEQKCDVLLGMTDSRACIDLARENEIFAIGYASDLSEYAPDSLLTSVLIDWSNIYQESATDALSDEWPRRPRWSGFAPGVIKMAPYHDRMPQGLKQFLDLQMRDTAFGAIHPFRGEVKDVDGVVRVAMDDILPDEAILSMDWLVEGMVLLD